MEVTHCCHCHCWNASPTTSLFSPPLFGLNKHSASVDECQWVQFFPHGWIQWPTFASYTLPCQTPFCHRVTKWNGILVRRFNLYHHHPPLKLWANIIKKKALLSQQSLHICSSSLYYLRQWLREGPFTYTKSADNTKLGRLVDMLEGMSATQEGHSQEERNKGIQELWHIHEQRPSSALGKQEYLASLPSAAWQAALLGKTSPGSKGS